MQRNQNTQGVVSKSGNVKLGNFSLNDSRIQSDAGAENTQGIMSALDVETTGDFSMKGNEIISRQEKEDISQLVNEPTQESQKIEQEEQGLTSIEEIKKNKPSWKERKDYQLALGTLIVTVLTGAIVPIVLKVTGKV